MTDNKNIDTLSPNADSSGPAPGIPLRRFAAPAVVACVILIAGGFVHRRLDTAINVAVGESAKPARPLSELSIVLGAWHGEDVPLDPAVLRISGEDAYLNRRYQSMGQRRSIDLFIGYTGGVRRRISHRPDVCFRAHGWKQISEKKVVVSTVEGDVPSVLYQFQSPSAGRHRVTVLASYLLNGRFTDERSSFTGYNERAPDLLGKRRPYVCRIQIASVATSDEEADFAALQEFAALVIEPIVTMMPDDSEDGESGAAKRIET
jgi:hypothetical protein